MVMYRTAVVGGPFWPLKYVLLQATIKHSWLGYITIYMAAAGGLHKSS